MSHAEMIAKAWLDDTYRAVLLAQGVEVPARPDDLTDDEIGLSADPQKGEQVSMSVPCNCAP
jgi:hypothetical protein